MWSTIIKMRSTVGKCTEQSTYRENKVRGYLARNSISIIIVMQIWGKRNF